MSAENLLLLLLLLLMLLLLLFVLILSLLFVVVDVAVGDRSLSTSINRVRGDIRSPNFGKMIDSSSME